ncbi:V-type proton ATPase subunit C [Thecamonas trahens ATCC 50062]|uniref:V-type proton ATPase subunit C n=1 Tax=Thecamonas trahens ATCC 50062 TaxID=461836 RepID=A0A0L0DQN0_THETB|nr:V-type proton ATPase subunit C [Thecamonas trahens ATCC 50062]KNC54565.1 V-type proton ATPase subunit C [Thecamonas trahens ATCC 50062]|eukprot:XP_013753580.1 V-type proton ATPase subunit C [Thecamonas trahens ATCC 50062]
MTSATDGPFLLCVPVDADESVRGSQYSKLSSSISAHAACTRFRIPSLRVGNLDALFALTDDLGRTDAYVESVARKIAKQGVDLAASVDGGASSSGAGNVQLSVEGGSMRGYVAEFSWNEQRYTSVGESTVALVQKIKDDVGRVEEQMKIKFAEVAELKSELAQLVRKTTGSLLMRSLDSLEGVKEVYMSTAFLTTVYVAVRNSAVSEFEAKYEFLVNVLDPDTMENFSAVVPRSAQCVAKDSEYTLFSVYVLAKLADDFKREAAASKFVVREFDAPLADDDAVGDLPDARNARGSLEERLVLKQRRLAQWCAANFGETYIAWVHLKAIRVHVEAVLRYGLPVSYLTLLVEPRRKAGTKLRAHLASLLGHLGDGATFGPGDEADGDSFYPYVSVDLSYDLP